MLGPGPPTNGTMAGPIYTVSIIGTGSTGFIPTIGGPPIAFKGPSKLRIGVGAALNPDPATISIASH